MKVDLSKKAESFRVSLAKKDILVAPTMRVGAAFDESTSMKGNIDNGKLQASFDKMMGVSLELDDNGELDCLAFNHRCRRLGVATAENHEGFVERNIKAGGSTCYAPIILESIAMFFEPKRPEGFFGRFRRKQVNMSPAFMTILTDGVNDRDDNVPLARALEAASAYPIFFQFVGVGGEKTDFPTIGELARTYPNVGEAYLPSFDMPDSEVYDQLVTDRLVAWFKRH